MIKSINEKNCPNRLICDKTDCRGCEVDNPISVATSTKKLFPGLTEDLLSIRGCSECPSSLSCDSSRRISCINSLLRWRKEAVDRYHEINLLQNLKLKENTEILSIKFNLIDFTISIHTFDKESKVLVDYIVDKEGNFLESSSSQII